MKIVTQMLVMDRRNSAVLRTVHVVTVRPVTPAEDACKRALEESNRRSHVGRLSLPAR